MQHKRRGFSESLWFPIQVLALGAILMCGFMSGPNGGFTKKRAVGENEIDSVAASTSIVRVSSEKPHSITSRVILLPLPTSARSATVSSLSFDVETRQFRFEKKFLISATHTVEAKKLRGPASEEGPAVEAWSLDNIKRKTGSAWESVPLVQNDTKQVLGSAFLEIEDDVTEFLVTFKNRAGEEASYPVRIRHVKTSTTS